MDAYSDYGLLTKGSAVEQVVASVPSTCILREEILQHILNCAMSQEKSCSSNMYNQLYISMYTITSIMLSTMQTQTEYLHTE